MFASVRMCACVRACVLHDELRADISDRNSISGSVKREIKRSVVGT